MKVSLQNKEETVKMCIKVIKDVDTKTKDLMKSNEKKKEDIEI